MTQSRIHWNNDELSLVLASAWTIYNEDKSLARESVFRIAQQVLPAERQRPVHSSTVYQFWPKLLKYTEKMKGHDVKDGFVMPTVTKASAPEALPLSPKIPYTPTLPTSAATPEPVPEYDNAPGIADMLTGLVLQVLYSPHVRGALRSLVAETLAPESDLEQMQAITWREPKAQRDRALRVVVAGGGGSFQNELRGVPRVDIRFWGTYEHESVHRLKAILQNADVAVVVVRYIGHNPVDVIRAREKAGKLRAIYWEGGNAAELRTHLAELAKPNDSPSQAH